MRLEECGPASSDPTANSIEPPVAGGKPASEAADEPGKLSPLADDADKIALLGHHRGRHADIPELNAPEFAPIKARLARAYLEHKAD